MREPMITGLLSLLLATSASAQPFEPPPPLSASFQASPAAPPDHAPLRKGNGAIISGWILTGVGALNLVTLPVCTIDIYPEDFRGVCVGASAAYAVVGLGVGVPLLAVGYSRRRAYREWKERRGLVLVPEATRVSLSGAGARVELRWRL